MKIEFQTRFWEELNPDKVEALAYVYGIMIASNLISNIMNDQYVLISINFLGVLLTILISRSRITYNEKRKNQQKTD